VYDALDRQTIDTVLKHGWQVISVSEDAACSDPDHDHSVDAHGDAGPTFTYTVGLGIAAGTRNC
jgi:hypothetical protein